MFQSRHEWFQHELDEHRKEWRCCLCSNELPFSSIPQLEVHLRSKHSEYGEDQTTAFLSLCERPPQYIPVSACPICAWGSSRSINPAYPISMASGSLSKKFWDPFMVLDVNPDDPHSTCVGFAASTGKRCRWRFESDRFDTLQRDNAVKRLISMSEIHPSEANPAALYLIARATLCYWHQNQANSKSAEWKERIESYLIDHSERLAGVGAKQLKSGSARDKDASEKEIEETRQVLESVTSDLKELQAIWSELIDKDSKGDETQAAKSQDVALLWQKLTECRKRKEKIGDQLRSLLQEEHTPRSDLPAGGPNMRPHSRDRDFHKAPVLRADLSSPTVMVSSLQFQRHVAHHLEQLALFALPPPMNESSGASSNQAAASRKSDRKTGSDAISEVSSTSLAPTDHANPPELYAAVMSGDIARVMQEIRNGADLTFHYGRFGNVIQTAAASLSWPSRDEIIHILLDYGADANMQGGIYGNTLQAVAANPGESGRRLSALETLLDCGAEVNAAGGRYGHALIAAAAVPTPPSSMLHEPTSMVLKILLDHGANPDAQGPKLYGSALHQAIKHDDNESVQLLLDRGASTTIRHVDYGTPVHHAMKTAYEPVWRRLRNAAVETNLERHYDRVRLSSALKIQRLFRYRQHGSGIPAFLRLSQSTVRAQYNDLAWKEKLRILQGRSDPSSLWVQDTSPMIMKRNRYGNVQPWQKSRIHLKVAEGESDYINASPISLRDSQTGVETKFIATQGPKESTSSHFWHMVWQETTDVAVIVMLTQTHDGTTEKCFQYFPLNVEVESFKIESLDTAEDAPKGTVTLLEYYLDVDSRTEVRKLSLKFGIETKDVWHFLFLGWSDFAVPEDNDRIALLNLLKLYVKKNTSSSNPTIVHDSAGVGRVGTFIALEHLLAQVETGAILNANESEDVIYDLVNRLREQRMLMVQMELQYQFLYNMVLDQLKERCPDMMSETDHDAKSEPDSKR